MSRIVLAHGTFDLIHYGHVLLFRAAREMGDRLIVTITADEFVSKGPKRPIFNELERLSWIREFRSVDEAHIIYERTGVGAILRFMPAIYVKGRDTIQGTDVIESERRAAKDCNTEIVYVNTKTTFHSSELLSGKYLI